MPTAVKPVVRADDVIAKAFQAIQTELQSYMFEREDVVEGMLITLLARRNAFLLGPPGVGKSMLCRELCSRFTDANYFEILLDRQLGKEEIFGPWDMPLYDTKGLWQRDPVDTILEAHIAFVDEVGKAGPATLNPLLTAFNEHLGKIGRKPEKIPLISAFGASNELLEDELSAMWDRFDVRLRVEDIRQPGNFVKLLVMASGTGRVIGTTIPLAELEYTTTVLVPAITIGQGVLDALAGLRTALQVEGVNASPRRWANSMRLLQASAFLNGRSAVDDDDLAILRHVLWEGEADIPIVEKTVLSQTSPLVRAALLVQDDIRQWAQQLEANRGESVEVKVKYGADLTHKINESTRELAAAIKTATNAGRNPARLAGALDQLFEIRYKLLIEAMQMDEETARSGATRQHAKILSEVA